MTRALAAAVVTVALIGCVGKSNPSEGGAQTATPDHSPTPTAVGSRTPAPSPTPTASHRSASSAEPAVPPTPTPQLPEAPWETDPVRPGEPHLREIAQTWARGAERESFGDCSLYAVVGAEADGDYAPTPWGPEFTRAGDYAFGWMNSDGETMAMSVSVWPSEHEPRHYRADGEPVQYADGSVIWWLPGGFDQPGLLAVPGEPCVYELRAGSRVDHSWLVNSLQPIAVHPRGGRP